MNRKARSVSEYLPQERKGSEKGNMHIPARLYKGNTGRINGLYDSGHTQRWEPSGKDE